MANKLAPYMHSLVDKTQTAFISDKYILDNVLAAHKIIHYVKQSKQKEILLKVDFEKT
jgi:hypothetical protein